MTLLPSTDSSESKWIGKHGKEGGEEEEREENGEKGEGAAGEGSRDDDGEDDDNEDDNALSLFSSPSASRPPPSFSPLSSPSFSCAFSMAGPERLKCSGQSTESSAARDLAPSCPAERKGALSETAASLQASVSQIPRFSNRVALDRLKAAAASPLLVLLLPPLTRNVALGRSSPAALSASISPRRRRDVSALRALSTTAYPLET